MENTYWALDQQQVFLLHIGYLVKCLKLAFIENSSIATDKAFHVSLVRLHVALAFLGSFFFLLSNG